MSNFLLHIHSGHRVCSVAASREEEIIFYRESDDSRSHHQLLPLMIQMALKTLDELPKAVHLYEGPGSYTGLRIGFSIVKGLCLGGGIPLICSHAGELHFEQFLKSGFSVDKCLSVFHARKNEVYAQLFERSQGAKWEGMKSVFLGDKVSDSVLTAENMTDVAVVGNAAQMFLEDFPELEIVWPVQLNAGSMIELGLKKWRNGDLSDLKNAKPLYLKPPHINKRKKNLL